MLHKFLRNGCFLLLFNQRVTFIAVWDTCTIMECYTLFEITWNSKKPELRWQGCTAVMQCFRVGCLQQERAFHNCPIPCLKNTRTNHWCRRTFKCTWSTCDSCRWKLRSVISGEWLLTSLTNSPVVTRRYKSCDCNFLQKIRSFAEVFLHISSFFLQEFL